jgi:uncharacterized protein (TIGR03000 family)
MYSMVLMAALTTGTDAPDTWLRGHGSCGGGCSGSTCSGYSSYGSCGGCSGSASYGCYGSYSYGCGGCSGSASYGCYGSYSYGCAGSYGSSWGSPSYSAYSGYACHGCYGCWGCSGCAGMSPYMAPTTPMREVVPLPRKEGSESAAPTKAKLIVELPSNATLFIDDNKMTTTSNHRVFNTPELETGETYFYMLRAEVVKDGTPVTVTKRVILKPGDAITADFRDLAAPTVTTARLP